MSIDLRRKPPPRRVSGARPRVQPDGGPAGFINAKARRLSCLGAGVLVVGLLASTFVSDRGSSALESEEDTPGRPPGDDAREPSSRDLANYAFHLPELDALPPTAAPGTEIEIWATWEPPVTRKLKVQRLIPRAVVDKVIPSIDPGPPTVVLELERRFIPDIMYGDRFGSLSVVIISEPDQG
ncbi:MAG: hypothetical protein ACRDK3_05500 [Actinomycetota bacterium]